MRPWRVLVTRKLLSAGLAGQAAQQGIRLTEQPFIGVKIIETEEKRQETAQALTQPAATGPIAVAFTSRNAVEGFCRQGMNPLPRLQIFCTSGATREYAAAIFGAAHIAGSAPDAASLAAVIAGQPEVQEIVFFCGDKRRDELPVRLHNRGIRVKEVMVYETTLLPLNVEEPYDAVVFFSPSAAHSFFAVNQPKAEVVCFSIGPTTTAAILRHTAGHRIVTCGSPSEQDMLLTIRTYFQDGLTDDTPKNTS